MTFLNNFAVITGLLLILYAVLLYLYPPKFKNFWYGLSTSVTQKNSIVWTAGQRLFSYMIFVMGAIYFVFGILVGVDKEHSFRPVLLLTILWRLSKFIVNKLLEKKNLMT